MKATCIITITMNQKQANELLKTGSYMFNGLLLTYDEKTEYYYMYDEKCSTRKIIRVMVQSKIKKMKMNIYLSMRG